MKKLLIIAALLASTVSAQANMAELATSMKCANDAMITARDNSVDYKNAFSVEERKAVMVKLLDKIVAAQPCDEMGMAIVKMTRVKAAQ